MNTSQKTISLSVRDNDHCKRIKDPINADVYHLETLLPFSEALKLDRGNANVRPPAEKKPLKMMMQTVDESPETFHLKNRGIFYLCDKFEFDNATRTITVLIPNLAKNLQEHPEAPKYGVADGGHTYEVISRTVPDFVEYREKAGWTEPYVRVRFLSGNRGGNFELEDIVEALNTSLQVQQYSLDEYKKEFDDLKVALHKSGFNVDLIAFRENEDKDWHVMDVIQRLSCFLKDRWQETQPASMYKASKSKLLSIFNQEETRSDFRKLYDVILEVLTFPEFIQSEFSRGGVIKGRRLGNLKPVRMAGKSGKSYTRPGTNYPTDHKIDMAALLPMAAAFRELLTLKGDRYCWLVDPREVFRASAESLYNVIATRSAKAKLTSHLGSDIEYWAACSQIVMRTQTRLMEQRLAANA